MLHLANCLLARPWRILPKTLHSIGETMCLGLMKRVLSQGFVLQRFAATLNGLSRSFFPGSDLVTFRAIQSSVVSNGKDLPVVPVHVPLYNGFCASVWLPVAMHLPANHVMSVRPAESRSI